MSATVIDAAHPHGIWTGDKVTVGRGDKVWIVSYATPTRVIVTRDIPWGHGYGWRLLRRYLDTPAKIASLKVVSR